MINLIKYPVYYQNKTPTRKRYIKKILRTLGILIKEAYTKRNSAITFLRLLLLISIYYLICSKVIDLSTRIQLEKNIVDDVIAPML